MPTNSKIAERKNAPAPRRRGRVDVDAPSRGGRAAGPSVAAAAPKASAPKSDRPAGARPDRKPKPNLRRPRPSAPRLGALDAAVEVLAALPSKEAATGLTAIELIERMRRARLWTSPAGKTPHATLYAAIIREMAQRRSDSRFKRVAPGRFASAAGAARKPKLAGVAAADRASERRAPSATIAKGKA